MRRVPGNNAQHVLTNTDLSSVQQRGDVYFCDSCSHVVHSPKSRSDHPVQNVVQPPEVADVSELDLLSVICIETNHYVCFVHWEKQWIFLECRPPCGLEWSYHPRPRSKPTSQTYLRSMPHQNAALPSKQRQRLSPPCI